MLLWLLLLFVCKNQLKVFIIFFSKSLIIGRKTNPKSKETHFDASSLALDMGQLLVLLYCIYSLIFENYS